MTQPDRYSRTPIGLQTWLNRTLGMPDPSPLPVMVTLDDVLTLATEYRKRSDAAQISVDAWQDVYGAYRTDMNDVQFAAWLKARHAADDARANAERAAWDAYRALEFTMLKHAVDTPREYSGIVDGVRVRAMYEPVTGDVTVLVGDEAVGE